MFKDAKQSVQVAQTKAEIIKIIYKNIEDINKEISE